MRIAVVDNVRDAACALAASGPLVAVKRGQDGAVGAHASGEVVEIQALPNVDPAGTIGAGDSFNEAFAALFDAR